LNLVTIGVGVAALLYGCYSAWVRQVKPERFWKLESMKRVYGPRAGVIVHAILYTIVPVVVGLVLIVKGWRGEAVF
jgi:hypothetical protein